TRRSTQSALSPLRAWARSARRSFIGLRAERRAAPKRARVPSGARPTYSSDEGLWAERRAAPKPARVPSGDRPTYSSDEGLSCLDDLHANLRLDAFARDQRRPDA